MVSASGTIIHSNSTATEGVIISRARRCPCLVAMSVPLLLRDFRRGAPASPARGRIVERTSRRAAEVGERRDVATRVDAAAPHHSPRSAKPLALFASLTLPGV